MVSINQVLTSMHMLHNMLQLVACHLYRCNCMHSYQNKRKTDHHIDNLKVNVNSKQFGKTTMLKDKRRRKKYSENTDTSTSLTFTCHFDL